MLKNPFPQRAGGASFMRWGWRSPGKKRESSEINGGGDTLAIRVGIERDRREAIGAARESAHALDELWGELAREDQSTDKRRTNDTEQDFREPGHHQGICCRRLKSGRDADDCDRVTCELEAI
jgi:hypothetical protein